MGKTLDDLFVDTKTAAEMITSLQDTASKAVRKDIEAYKQVWEHKNPEEQKKYQAQATAWATRHAGHRAICPACGNTGLIHGSSQGAVSTTLGEEDVIVQKQMMLPSAFECIACGLKITGLSKLSACNLGDAFTATSTLSAAEFFGLHTDEELEEARAEFPEPDWEEDSNE
jgi:hypothetical protein